MIRKCATLVMLSMLVFTCSAADDANDIASSTVRSAKTKYDEEMASAQRVFDQHAQAASTSYLRSLDAAIKEQTRAGNLDDAVKIKALRDEVASSVVKPAPDRNQFAVVYAAFGGGGKWKNVTDTLGKLAKNNSLAFTPSREMFKVEGDPAFGQWKFVFVVYTVGQKIYVHLSNESDPIRLPSNDPGLIR